MMAVFPVCDVLQGGTPVPGPVDDRPSFSEEHFLLQYFVPALHQTPTCYRLQTATCTTHSCCGLTSAGN